MRKTIYTILISSFVISSCEKLLEVEAENTISGNTYTTQEGLEQALTGAYYSFTGISDGASGGELLGGDFILIPELLGKVNYSSTQEFFWEFVLAPSAYRDFINKDILETNSRVEANWQRSFETINIVNNILANIDVVSEQSVRNRITGEALAIRGILLYEMVVLWAPQYDAPGVTPSTTKAIPFRTEPIVDINNIPKISSSDVKSIKEVYDQAEEDLLDASVLLEPFGENGTSLSYYASQSYLAKLNLQKANWAQAIIHCNNVLDGTYSLAPTPFDAFNNSSNSTEDIFAIQQTLANNVGDRSSGFGIIAFYSSLPESGLGVYRSLEPTFNNTFFHNVPQFSENDLRGEIDYSVDSTTSYTQISTMYYQSIADEKVELVSTSKYTNSQFVLPIIRLAEIYLIRAESELFDKNAVTTQAIEDLNAVRTRAGINPVLLSDFADVDEFFDSLALERSREFMHEGMILEDLKRWGGFVGRKGSETAEYDTWDERFILPIPRSEKDTWTD